MSVNSFSGQPAIPASYGFTAGKNKILNSDFSIWQRGTSFSSDGFTADRWYIVKNTAATIATSQQTFTPATAPVAGYEGQYYIRTVTGVGSDTSVLGTRLEDVRLFAGQTVTLSFWAKAASTLTLNLRADQNFGSGGSAAVAVTGGSVSVTTSWVRYSATISIPSVSGKTIGTGSYLNPFFYWSNTAGVTLDIWGVQLEAGATATSFQTATGTVQGELAACQRYYQRLTGNTSNTAYFGTGVAISTTRLFANYQSPVVFRSAPSIAHSSAKVGNGVITNQAITSISNYANAGLSEITVDTSVGSGLTASGAFMLVCDQNAYIEFNAEL